MSPACAMSGSGRSGCRACSCPWISLSPICCELNLVVLRRRHRRPARDVCNEWSPTFRIMCSWHLHVRPSVWSFSTVTVGCSYGFADLASTCLGGRIFQLRLSKHSHVSRGLRARIMSDWFTER
ncbi:hypothetical protein BRADI_1g36566v3 [Brachypodium distachyon]|uniref:Uncharacterized protein n=1 Tax=Brachypodium distachyon TaxID=15368 RepID=A0A0Q3NK53_BRADI|nr:hypothetical protein BRADI_1g36566v3 [Brachypodium distachyon]